jgi:molecular chaperone GrpE
MEEEIQSDTTGTAETTDGSGALPEVTALVAERDQLLQQKADLQDRTLRLQAEFDNFRRRAERERMEFAEYAGMEIVRSLLGTLDDFERALKAARDSGSADSPLTKGVELVYSRLNETLAKQGLTPIAAENATFDPHLHQAVDREETDRVEEGTILQEYQKGYNFKGKMLRPAMVKVSVRP